jgi:aryl-alcohol dehydrogenase-like predicted oxidoreductase
MEHRPVGKTGVNLPPIIFGTSALGNLYTALSDETKTAIVKECLLHVPKPVVFDSAGKYGAGLALEKLGEILHDLRVDPGDIVISNKLGWLRTTLSSPLPTFEKGVWVDIKTMPFRTSAIRGSWNAGTREMPCLEAVLNHSLCRFTIPTNTWARLMMKQNSKRFSAILLKHTKPWRI